MSRAGWVALRRLSQVALPSVVIGLVVALALAGAMAFDFFRLLPSADHLQLTVRQDLQQVAVFIIAGLLVSALAALARLRAVEAEQRRVEADFAADLARLTLSHDDLCAALREASAHLAARLSLPGAAIELGEAPAPASGEVTFPLRDEGERIGTLRLAPGTPTAVAERVRRRVIPGLEAVLHVARDRQQMVASLRESQRSTAELLAEQEALRRVATLVARGAAPAEVFSAVTLELHRLFTGFATALVRYEPDDSVTSVADRDEHGREVQTGFNVAITPNTVTGNVLRTWRPARVDNYDRFDTPIARHLRRLGQHSSVGVPVVVEGRLWGVALIMSPTSGGIPPDTERRLQAFTDLIGTAVANADNRAQLVASRARLVTAADDARRRIERDLHDGAQQRIMSLALQLRMAEESVAGDHPEIQDLLSGTVQTLTEIHESLRELSSDIHPTLLSQGGIAPMLRKLARGSGVPVDLDLRIDQRVPERVEVAMYYLAAEALANAARHAEASVVCLTAEADPHSVRMIVSDDGVGGADPVCGAGLTGLRDRVEALGGRMSVVSPLGRGTTVTAEIPLQTDPSTPPAADAGHLSHDRPEAEQKPA